MWNIENGEVKKMGRGDLFLLRTMKKMRDNNSLPQEDRLEAARAIKAWYWKGRVFSLATITIVVVVPFLLKVKDLTLSLLALAMIVMVGLIWWASELNLKENQEKIMEIEGRLEREAG